jgi:hypothetical protein
MNEGTLASAFSLPNCELNMPLFFMTTQLQVFCFSFRKWAKREEEEIVVSQKKMGTVWK